MAWLDDQPLDLDAGIYGNIALSVVLALFAVGVGWLARFRGPAGWYAVFGASFGLTTISGSLNQSAILGADPVGLFRFDAASLTDASSLWLVGTTLATGFFGAFWARSIAGLLASYGVPQVWRRKGGWAAAGIVFAAAIVTVGDIMNATVHPAPWPIAAGFVVQYLTTAIAVGWMFYGAGALAFSHIRAPEVAKPILAAAFMAYPILNAANNAADIISARLIPTVYLIAPLATLVVAIPWIIAHGRTGGRGPKRVVVTALTFLVAGTLLGIYVPLAPLAGSARLFDVLLVAYAVMRLQYLDLDVKVRWGISKTTIAALFITVFFVISEGAAAVFSEQWGSGLGIAAAGALVFAIAPIMKWADGVAARAVPVQVDAGEAEFIGALRMALADGAIDEAEEDRLAELADTLGLTFQQARGLRRQVE